MKKHWADKPVLRDIFWFLVYPERLKSYLAERERSPQCVHKFEPFDAVGGLLYEKCKECGCKRIYEHRFNANGGIVQ